MCCPVVLRACVWLLGAHRGLRGAFADTVSLDKALRGHQASGSGSPAGCGLRVAWSREAPPGGRGCRFCWGWRCPSARLQGRSQLVRAAGSPPSLVAAWTARGGHSCRDRAATAREGLWALNSLTHRPGPSRRPLEAGGETPAAPPAEGRGFPGGSRAEPPRGLGVGLCPRSRWPAAVPRGRSARRRASLHTGGFRAPRCLSEHAWGRGAQDGRSEHAPVALLV